MPTGDKEYWSGVLRKKKKRRHTKSTSKKLANSWSKPLIPAAKQANTAHFVDEPADHAGFMIYCMEPNKPKAKWKFAGNGRIVDHESDAVLFSSPDAAELAIAQSRHKYPRWAFVVVAA